MYICHGTKDKDHLAMVCVPDYDEDNLNIQSILVKMLFGSAPYDSYKVCIVLWIVSDCLNADIINLQMLTVNCFLQFFISKSTLFCVFTSISIAQVQVLY
ncbi:hypothetical protein CHS0354_005914 [Potamilus streckersoni]|uniref:Uncharacterized protein n=1 Tax=Potamilus streckersoni TaxID=2493646 RepID=A0AAE0T273_9BIVA|nr:hypothetical protein CHS0354_005914 [Potamilus streckersoni]